MTITRRLFDRLYARRLSPAAQALFRLYGALHPLRHPLFLIGLNRSGTSVFTRLLAKSGQIVNWSEANDLWDPVGYPWEEDRVARPFWPLDPQAYTDCLLADHGGADGPYARAIPGICAMYVAAHPGEARPPRFLNKSPMNTLRMDVLQQMFPDACFIGIVRDPRAVVRSWAEKSIPKLRQHPRSAVETDGDGKTVYVVDGTRYSRTAFLERLCESYCHVVGRQLEQFEALPDDRKFHTRYEDFVADIHGVLRRIDEQFGLDPSQRQWDRIPPTQESRNVKFRREFDEAELRLVAARCARMIRRLGYEP